VTDTRARQKGERLLVGDSDNRHFLHLRRPGNALAFSALRGLNPVLSCQIPKTFPSRHCGQGSGRPAMRVRRDPATVRLPRRNCRGTDAGGSLQINFGPLLVFRFISPRDWALSNCQVLVPSRPSARSHGGKPQDRRSAVSIGANSQVDSLAVRPGIGSVRSASPAGRLADAADHAHRVHLDAIRARRH